MNFTIEHFLDKDKGKEFECPICFDLMFTICELNECGHLFCQKCIKCLTECPICRNKNMDYHISKYLQRKLYEQKVKCFVPNCDKIFSLSDSDEHLMHVHNFDDHKYNKDQNIYDLKFSLSHNAIDFINIIKSINLSIIFFKFTPTGMEIQNLNDSKTLLYYITFNINKFNNFYCESDIYFSISVKDLLDMFKFSNHIDIKFEHIKNEKDLLIRFKVSNNLGLFSFQRKININTFNIFYNIPNIPMQCKVILPLTYLTEIWNNNKITLSKLEAFTITHTHEYIKMILKRKNNTYASEYTYKYKEHIDIDIDLIDKGISQISNTYYISDINKIINFARINNKTHVELLLKENYPLTAKYKTNIADVLISIAL